MNKTMNLTQAAEHTGIKKRTLFNMIKDRRFIDPIKGTKPRLWLTSDVDKWLESGK